MPIKQTVQTMWQGLKPKLPRLRLGKASIVAVLLIGVVGLRLAQIADAGQTGASLDPISKLKPTSYSKAYLKRAW